MINPWDGINRRRYLRVEFPYTIHIYSTQGKPISTYTEDISSGGVRVVTQQKLHLSDIVDLKIYIGDEFIRSKGKVVWIKEKSSPVLEGVLFYSAGIEFVGLSKNDSALLARCADELDKKRKKPTKGKP